MRAPNTVRSGARLLLPALAFSCAACGPTGAGASASAESVTDEPTAGVTADALLDGDYWRAQGLEDVLPAWTRNGQDTEAGAFFAEMDREWRPSRDLHKYPGMVARHLFSYSAAYLLTGDAAHLDVAGDVFGFLVDHGWDEAYGGWYDELDRDGSIVADTKDLFNQAYAVTGLAMYWVVTRDPVVRRYLDRSMEILERHAWDEELGGYVRSLNRDLSVREWRKDFSPQIAHVSGYLAYLYPALRDPVLLQRMERILGVVMERTRDPETGWVLGRFDRSWRYDGPEDRRTNVGHDLETGWLLMRLHLLTGDDAYRDQGLRLATSMLEHAYQPETGAWAHQLRLATGEVHRNTTPWWVQAYGNMVQLYQYRLTGDRRHLEVFRSGAEFWNRAFMDPEHGAVYLSVYLDGSLHRGDKAVRTKTSYHSMEYALLNYLYLTLWVEEEPATLHYRIVEPNGATLHPSLLEDPEIRITAVEIDGRPWSDYDPEEGSITLPADVAVATVTVVLEAS
ncbi:MAG: AGE family epimerase/isomerase [Longimicrobiales bacterium]|nr:AGE family epimerase/isomerase [Longimicrobiales bacterium]